MTPAGSLRRIAARLGLPGWGALVLATAAAWMHGVVLPARGAELASVLDQARDAARGRQTNAPADSPREALARLYADLPDDRDSNATLATLLEHARAQGLAVDAVQFQTEGSRLPCVRRHRVNLPLHGHYESVRGWIAQTLHDEPAIAIEGLELKRKDVGSDGIDALVTLSLWARETAPCPGGARGS
jgi:Tfp pilus assembly protein PilO